VSGTASGRQERQRRLKIVPRSRPEPLGAAGAMNQNLSPGGCKTSERSGKLPALTRHDHANGSIAATRLLT
jgi:hypothetical protein